MNIKQVKCLAEQAMKKSIIFYRETEEWKRGIIIQGSILNATYPLSHPECWENDKEETISFWPLFSITPSTLLTDDLLSPRHRWHRCEQVGKGHDTYIPSSITYDLISRNRTITAPTWWDWFENEVNICSASKAMLVQTGTSHAKVCSIR